MGVWGEHSRQREHQRPKEHVWHVVGNAGKLRRLEKSEGGENGRR